MVHNLAELAISCNMIRIGTKVNGLEVLPSRPSDGGTTGEDLQAALVRFPLADEALPHSYSDFASVPLPSRSTIRRRGLPLDFAVTGAPS